ncbi:hypothetical protein [Acinetobacter oleivorans]|uniref:hypothetical protein n=1 Tax=Acinetobacter oleivorans TaxID=1148157 RepID=UPI001250BD98|nr:hypothetical protein [Acinetobacter oleivorans]
MDIHAIKQDIVDLERSRNEINDKINNINSANYELSARKYHPQDLVDWNNDVAYLNKRIFDLKKQIKEIEDGQN